MKHLSDRGSESYIVIVILFCLVREWIPGITESVNDLDCNRVNIFWSLYKLVKTDVGATSFLSNRPV